jgi:hypothetical protein
LRRFGYLRAQSIAARRRETSIGRLLRGTTPEERAMTIKYAEDQQLELWVKDTGQFEGFAIFLNGSLAMQIGDQTTRKIPITRPSPSAAIVIHFGGVDGGISAIVDVTDAAAPQKLADHEGLKHSYLIERV